MVKIFFFIFFILTLQFLNAADNYFIFWTDEKPIIDGLLDDTIWQLTPKYKMVDAMTGKEAEIQTLVAFACDSEFLFISFDVFDSSIFAFHTNRDAAIYEEDVCELFIALCDNEETKSYIEIEVNPLNTIFDAFLKTNININFDEAKKWNADNIISTVFQKTNGWQLEIQLPLSYINFSSKNNSISLNATRIDRDNKESEYRYFALSPTFGWFHKPECFINFLIKK
ncbi:MAG TPA: carbohydrate-binding family 9-like protein [bacterium]|nr:carbohydrate-binding family 9-like protein [bacterium]HOL48594.1 carbohydrate-binding family 9-like protein [bacterium]HPQ19779.1 carbohydrate-binding family 9-like protein [bacterium]